MPILQSIPDLFIALSLIISFPDQGRPPGGRNDPVVPRDSLVKIAAVGDIMMGSTWPPGSTLPADDGEGMFDEVRYTLEQADLAFGNLEAPLLDGGKTTKCGPKSTDCYAFRMPARYVRHLKKAGFDVFSLANNHALDFGPHGRLNTMSLLDSAGIHHTGMPGDIARIRIRETDIVLIAFSYDDDSYNLNREKKARAIIRSLREGCDILVVSFHGGAEGASRQRIPKGRERFLGEDRGNLRRFSHAVIDEGADLVLGHGPHVVRALELYRDRLIAYSLGNFATYGQFTLTGPNGIALILEVLLKEDGSFHSGRIHPIRQEKPGGPRVDSTGAVIPILRELSMADFPRSPLQIDGHGILHRRQAGKTN